MVVGKGGIKVNYHVPRRQAQETNQEGWGTTAQSHSMQEGWAGRHKVRRRHEKGGR